MIPPIIDIAIDGEPVPKGRPRLGARGHTYTPAATLAAERALGWRVRERYPGLAPTGRPVGLDLTFRTAHDGRARRGRADLDNLIKLVSDALNGIAWVDDSQVVAIRAAMERGAPDPGTAIRVYPIGDDRD